MSDKILVIDDESMICQSLEAGLSDMGYQVRTAMDKAAALEAVRLFKPDAVLTDMRLGAENGIDLIGEIKAMDSDIEVVVMTAYSDIASAVRAIKEGAFDYINKPFELEEIGLILERARDSARTKHKLRILETQSKQTAVKMIGHSPAMGDVQRKIEILSKNDNVTVLILGETGTGKELVADAIHDNSIRRDDPILKINCCTIPAHLVESELFGYEKNAFTGAVTKKKGLFEIADKGTVFLDELGELPLEIQSKLLRFLEERKFRRIGGLEDVEVDVRIIAATNRDLAREVRENRFREDLYYRLNVVPVELPPLRVRGDDLIQIAEYFLDRYNASFQKEIQGFDSQCIQRMMAYSWPGNIRELKNVIERIVILSEGPWITVDWLPPEIRDFQPVLPTVDDGTAEEAGQGEGSLEYMERSRITRAMEKHAGNQTKAAEELGISRYALRRKLEKWDKDDVK